MDVIKKTTRELLIDAAVELMSVKGYHGMSMSDLEKKTKLGRSSIYHHVASKEALLAEICDYATKKQTDYARHIVAIETDPKNSMFLLIKSLLAEIINYRERALVSIREFNFLQGDYREAVLKNRRAYEDCWKEILKHAKSIGLIKNNTDFDLKLMLGMINYSPVWLRSNPESSIDKLAERYLKIVINSLNA